MSNTLQEGVQTLLDTAINEYLPRVSLSQVKFLTRDSYLNKVVTSQLLDLDAKLPAKHKTLPLPGYMQVTIAATRLHT